MGSLELNEGNWGEEGEGEEEEIEKGAEEVLLGAERETVSI